ncbi:MAG: hypothetical protein PF436_05010 [Prolixibacteraceae bacterium]|jgi:hypothetical protein|nr:hypothetical protein [Prolixibacteraceae bacterium]
MVLILFSTIGFNIITTFCSGCDDEHFAIAIIPVTQQDETCECCGETDGSHSCCITDTHDHQHEKQHHSTSEFARLNIDATEAKAKSFQLQTTVITIQLAATMLEFIQAKAQPLLRSTNRSSNFIQKGRDILTHICVMRN